MSDLRFEDVRTGDKITVEVTTPDHPESKVTITGTATTGLDSGMPYVYVAFAGSNVFYRTDDGHWFLEMNDNTATLTAHEPAPPEWHKAQVIKADTPRARDRYMVPAAWCRSSGMWSDGSGYVYSNDELTDLTVVVDEHGNRP